MASGGATSRHMKEEARKNGEETTTLRADLSRETTATLEKLKRINAEVSGLDPLLKDRAISLLWQTEFPSASPVRSIPTIVGRSESGPSSGSSETDFAGLVERWTPTNGNEWALLAAYHCVKGRTDGVVSGQDINAVLKNHGKGLSNVTKAVSRLARSDPSLMLQVRKDGTSRQARKTYKVTTSGVAYIQERLKAAPGSEV
jgi:hypothetical protein